MKRRTTSPLLELRRKLDEPRTLTARATMKAGNGPLVIEGHAAVFDAPTTIVHGRNRWTEVVARGAFRKLLAAGPDVVLQFDHDGQPLARTSNGTLELREDDHGLRFRATLAETQLARDVHQLVSRGDLNGCSFTFAVSAGGDRWESPSNPDPDDFGIRTLLDIAVLRDVSVVTHPAYPQTGVAARHTNDSDQSNQRGAGAVAEPQAASAGRSTGRNRRNRAALTLARLRRPHPETKD